MHLCLDLREIAKWTYLGGVPLNTHLLLSPAVPAYVKAPPQSMVAYMVACHWDMSILILPLYPAIYLPPNLLATFQIKLMGPGGIGVMGGGRFPLRHIFAHCHPIKIYTKNARHRHSKFTPTLDTHLSEDGKMQKTGVLLAVWNIVFIPGRHSTLWFSSRQRNYKIFDLDTRHWPPPFKGPITACSNDLNSCS